MSSKPRNWRGMLEKTCRSCGRSHVPALLTKPHRCKSGESLGSKVRPLPGQLGLPLTGVPREEE